MGEETKIAQSTAPSLCQGCVNWQLFGGKCFFYWEGKQECSQYRVDQWGNAAHKSVKQRFDLF